MESKLILYQKLQTISEKVADIHFKTMFVTGEKNIVWDIDLYESQKSLVSSKILQYLINKLDLFYKNPYSSKIQKILLNEILRAISDPLPFIFDEKERISELEYLEYIEDTVINDETENSYYLNEHLNYSEIEIDDELIKKIKKIIDQELNVKIIEKPKIIKFDYLDPIIYKQIIQNPELLKTMDWRIFEKLLADILQRLGYEIELNKGTKDGGIDIFAIRNMEFGSHRYLIQAKRWKNKVGVSPIRELLYLHDKEKATKSCLVTTSSFTAGAWKEAEINKWKLELRDFKGIMNWIKLIQK